MSTSHLILWLVVFAVAFPASFRNPTAGALAACYVLVEFLTRIGHPLPVQYFILPDIAVLAVIVAKPERYPCGQYRGMIHQLRCLLTERSWADRFIICSYPFVWLTYGADVSEVARYWALWGWAIAQYLAAGSEALFDQVHRRNADAANSPPPRGSLLVAYPAGGWSG